MLNQFDYGPLYNEQILLGSEAEPATVPIENDTPNFGGMNGPQLDSRSSTDYNK